MVVLLLVAAWAAPASAAPVVDGLAPDRAFSPDGDGQEDAATIAYRVSVRSRVTVDVLDGDGAVVRRLQADVPTEGGASVSWDGRRAGTTAVVDDGVYGYRVTAEDGTGERTTATGRIAVDTAPVATLTTPEPDEVVTGTVRVAVSGVLGRRLDAGEVRSCPWESRCGYWFVGSLSGDLGADGSTMLATSWDTSGVPAREQFLAAQVSYRDVFGAPHAYDMPPRRVVVQRPVTIRDRSADRYFSPDGDGQDDTGSVSFTLTAPATVAVRIRDADGALVRRLETGVSRDEGGQWFTWDGRDDAGAVVPDGIYGYTVDAEGAVGEPASVAGHLGVDTAPIATVTSPAPDEAVTGVRRIVVTGALGRELDGGHVFSCPWEAWCSYGYAGTLAGELGADGSPVLATDWDTATFPAGRQWLGATVTFRDGFGVAHDYRLPLRRVEVQRPVTIRDLSPDRSFSPDGDGQEDTGGVGFALTAPATVTMRVRDGDGRLVRELERAQPHAEGWQSIGWDGRDDEGAVVPDGVYRYTVEAQGVVGEPATASGRIGVDTAPVATVTSPVAGEAVTGTQRITVTGGLGRRLIDGSVYTCPYAGRCQYWLAGFLGRDPGADDATPLHLDWDTAAVPTQGQWLDARVRYVDAFGALHDYSVPVHRVEVQRPVTVVDVSPDRAFSPDADGFEDVVDVGYRLTASATVTVRIRDADGALVRRLETDETRSDGWNTFRWDGRDDDGAVVPDGVYRYAFDAEGAIGDPASVTGRIGVDTRPVASVASPAPDETVSGETPITVVPAAGRTLTDGYAYGCPYDSGCAYYALGWFGTPDFDGSRSIRWATRDVPTGTQFVTVSASYDDAFGQRHWVTLPRRRVVVTRAVVVSGVSADRYFTPDGDGQEDVGGPTFCLDGTADVAFVVRTASERTVRTIRESRGQGCQSVAWDGRDDDGAPVPEGAYAYTLTATVPDGAPSTVAGRIGVRRGAQGEVVRPAADDVVSRSAVFELDPQGVQVTQVWPCVAGACAPITAANAQGRWATTMNLAAVANGPAELSTRVRWRDPFGSSHETTVGRAVRVDTSSPEVELTATAAQGEAPLDTRLRLDAHISTGRDLTYAVDFGDGSERATGRVAAPYAPIDLTHRYERAGSYRARVDVHDGAGNAAVRSVAITVLRPRNRAPEARLEVTPDEGVAPLRSQVTVRATDPDGDDLTSTLSFGDGTPVVRGPHDPAAAEHVYEHAGSYLLRVAVSDGQATSVATRRVVVGEPAPLVAVAGDPQRAVVGDEVRFDAGASRPAASITHYRWEFGDGQEADGARPAHAYERPGTYDARLTVHAGARTATDVVRVSVVAPPTAPGLAVRIRDDQGPVPGAEASVVAPDGTRTTATAGGDGTATLQGLPDGPVTVYAWAAGHRPRAVQAVVQGGRGTVDAALDRGDVGATTLESHRMTPDEITAAGIDVADPQNSHVYEARIHLFFVPDEEPTEGREIHVYVTPSGIVCASRCGESTPPGPGPGGSGGGVPCANAQGPAPCFGVGGYSYVPRVQYVDGEPLVQWLVLPMRASFLKEFFDVKMVVQNLTTDFAFDPGVASLQLPAGLTLAPTAHAQEATRDVGRVPAGESRTVDWVVRGDVEGSYDLSATYSSTVAGLGRPVFLRAASASPLKVWGGSALRTRILVDEKAVRWGPYGVDVEVENVSDAPVYNMQVEMLDQPADAPPSEAPFFFAPQPPQAQGTAAIEPGRKWRAHYVLFAGLGSEEVERLKVVLERSFVERTGGDVDLRPTLGLRDGPSLGPSAGPVDVDVVHGDDGRDRARLRWLRPATEAGTTVTGFQLWTRDALRGGAWRHVDDVPSAASGQNELLLPASADAGRYYGIGTVLSDGTVAFRHALGIGPSRYVSLGDSFSSGEGVPAFEPGTASDVQPVPKDEAHPVDNRCHRSARGSYGRRLLEDASVPVALEPATFAACSGAIARDVDDPDGNGDNDGEVAQEQHVSQFTDVVSLSMGGNDIGFSDIATLCATVGCGPAVKGLQAVGTEQWFQTLADMWNEAGFWGDKIKTGWEAGEACVNPVDLPAKVLCAYKAHKAIKAVEEILDRDRERETSPRYLYGGQLVTRLTRAYRRLAGRAPNARIMVQPYPLVVGNDGPAGDCVLVPGLPLSLSAGSRTAIVSVITRLNAAIRQAAEQTNDALAAGGGRRQVEVVDLGSRFAGRELCRGGTLNPASGFNSLTNPVFDPTGAYGPVSYSFHPNADGQRAYAAALADAIKGGLSRSVRMVPREDVAAGSVLVPFGARTLRVSATVPAGQPALGLRAVSPSGVSYAARSLPRADRAGGTTRSGRTETEQWLEVDAPERGEWRLVVRDDATTGDPRSTEVSAVPIVPPPAPPHAEIAAEPVAPGSPAFALRAVGGPAGATYRWTFSDDTTAAGPDVRHAFAGEAPRWALLEVTSEDGVVATTTRELGNPGGGGTPGGGTPGGGTPGGGNPGGGAPGGGGSTGGGASDGSGAPAGAAGGGGAASPGPGGTRPPSGGGGGAARPAPPAPRIGLLRGSSTVRVGRTGAFTIAVACPAGGRCPAKLVVTAAAPAGRRRGTKRPTPVVVATAAWDGKGRAVAMRLTPTGRRMLRAGHGSLRVTVALRATGGRTDLRAKRVRLRAADS